MRLTHMMMLIPKGKCTPELSDGPIENTMSRSYSLRVIENLTIYKPYQGRRRRGAAGACAPALSKVGGGHKWV